MHGGWDSLARRPLPVRSVLPPGSVLLCEILDREPFAATVAAAAAWWLARDRAHALLSVRICGGL